MRWRNHSRSCTVFCLHRDIILLRFSNECMGLLNERVCVCGVDEEGKPYPSVSVRSRCGAPADKSAGGAIAPWQTHLNVHEISCTVRRPPCPPQSICLRTLERTRSGQLLRSIIGEICGGGVLHAKHKWNFVRDMFQTLRCALSAWSMQMKMFWRLPGLHPPSRHVLAVH